MASSPPALCSAFDAVCGAAICVCLPHTNVSRARWHRQIGHLHILIGSPLFSGTEGAAQRLACGGCWFHDGWSLDGEIGGKGCTSLCSRILSDSSTHMQPLDAAQEQLLIADAVAAQQNAYAPYSRFSVGAALLLENGQVFKGANVENASYGATICAERSAICSAISQLGPAKFRPKAIAVATDLEEPASPCGICRQSLAEFGNLAVLLFSRSSKRLVKSSVQELLPLAFMPHHLDEHNSASSGKVKES